MFPLSDTVKRLTRDYQEARHAARTGAFSLVEFSDQDILRYELERGFVAGLPVPTGEDVTESYTANRPLPTLDHERDIRADRDR